MDTLLYEKLPCGAGWWNISYKQADKWMQSHYDIPSSTKQAEGLPEPKETCAPAGGSPFISREKHEAVQQKTGTLLWKVVLHELDPLSSLYTKDQEMDAIDTIRTRFLSFVTGLAHPFFGPKRSRVLSMWLSNNRINEKDSVIIEDFLRFIFEEKATAWSVSLGPRHEWYCKN